MRFTATEFEIDPEDEESLAAVFLYGTNGSERAYLSLTRFTDDQDDGHIEIELCEQTRHAKDGITRCSVTESALALELEAGAASSLSTTSPIEVRFTMNVAERARLITTLRSIFRDRLELLGVDE